MMEIIYGLGKATWIVLVAIPGSFWGIVVGSFFSLGGVYLTNRANDRRLRQQLEHDRDLKNRDREMLTRKEIFLAATEAINASLIAMVRLPDLNIPHGELDSEFRSKASSMAKVHIVATEPSLKAFIQISGEIGAAFQRLLAQRLPLGAKKNDLDVHKTLIDGFLKEQARVLELIKEDNLAGNRDPQRQKQLADRFQFESERMAETHQEADALGSELYTEQLRFGQECMKETFQLWRLMVPVVASARRELNFPLDEGVYTALVEEAINKQVASMQESTRLLPVAKGETPSNT
jgi:hypothetical protein